MKTLRFWLVVVLLFWRGVAPGELAVLTIHVVDPEFAPPSAMLDGMDLGSPEMLVGRITGSYQGAQVAPRVVVHSTTTLTSAVSGSVTFVRAVPSVGGTTYSNLQTIAFTLSPQQPRLVIQASPVNTTFPSGQNLSCFAARVLSSQFWLQGCIGDSPVKANSELASYDESFGSSAHDWQFYSDSTNFPNPPVATTNYASGYVGVKGSQSNGGESFGYWEYVDDTTYNDGWLAKRVFYTTSNLSSPVSPVSIVPSVRLRNSTYSFGASSELTIPSVGQCRATLSSTWRDYTVFQSLVHSLPAGAPRLYSHVDYFNFDLADDRDGEIRISRSRTYFFDLYDHLHYWKANSPSSAYSKVAGYQVGQFGSWSTSGNIGTDLLASIDGQGRLQMGSTASQSFAFVQWISPNIGVMGSGLYAVRVAITRPPSSPSVNTSEIPTLRVRVFPATNELAHGETFADNKTSASDSDDYAASPRPSDSFPTIYWAFFSKPAWMTNSDSTQLKIALDYIQVGSQVPDTFRVHAVDVWRVGSPNLIGTN